MVGTIEQNWGPPCGGAQGHAERMKPPAPLLSRLMTVGLLALAAIWATVHSPTIFFDHQILLGYSLGIFALLQFGWLGLPVGVASALSTITLWGHPWAALILLLQLLWLQLFLSHFNGNPSERGNGRIVLATIAFWLVIGLPLRSVLYSGLLQVDLSTAMALSFKEAVVSVVDAALALLLYLVLQLSQRRGRPTVLSLRGLVFTVLLLMISLPGVLIITVLGQQVTDRAIVESSLRLEQRAEAVAFLLSSRDNTLPSKSDLQPWPQGLAFALEGHDGRRLISDPSLFASLQEGFSPSVDNVRMPNGLTLLIPNRPISMLQRKMQGYWSYTRNVPGPWRRLTVVQPAGGDIAMLLASIRPALWILGILLIVAALVSEAITTLLASQFNRIVSSLTPLEISEDPEVMAARQITMPELQPTRLRELNRVVQLINHQARIFNQLSRQLQQSHARLRLYATTDDLTGLLNRRELIEKLEGLLAHPDRRRDGSLPALLFLDLDLFKEINDNFGHAAGDTVLRTVADRIRESLRIGDLAGRTGGDEMIVVLMAIPDLDTARGVARKIGATIAQPITGPQLHATITASIGVALAKPGETADALIARADQAMYAAKQGGRNQVITIA